MNPWWKLSTKLKYGIMNEILRVSAAVLESLQLHTPNPRALTQKSLRAARSGRWWHKELLNIQERSHSIPPEQSIFNQRVLRYTFEFQDKISVGKEIKMETEMETAKCSRKKKQNKQTIQAEIWISIGKKRVQR